MLTKYSESLKSLVLKLFEIKAFKFGNFVMKSGISSPIYFDLRVIISHPKIMETVTDLLISSMKERELSCDHICGVPYTALPIASLISVKEAIPMLIRRKETKGYGTNKLIEGQFSAEDSCLIIEDVVTSGSSIMETISDLRMAGITVTDCLVVVDREQGGSGNIKENGVQMHSLFTLSFLLNILKDAGKIEESTVKAVEKYIAESQIKRDSLVSKDQIKTDDQTVRTRLTYSERANMAKCPVAIDLFNLMTAKKTNLCVAADLTSSIAILNIAEAVGPYICILKTHVDIITDFSKEFIDSLKALAEKYNFLLLEDRKFADIGNTVALQYKDGIFSISSWADLVTAHSLPGDSILKGLKSVLNGDKKRGVFLLAELSSSGNLINPAYSENTVKMATDGNDIDFVAGIVAQNKNVVTFPGLIQLTPGVKIGEMNDVLGQQYNTPEHVIKHRGADIAVVGRGIIEAKCPMVVAKLYRDELWTAYCQRVGIDETI